MYRGLNRMILFAVFVVVAIEVLSSCSRKQAPIEPMQPTSHVGDVRDPLTVITGEIGS